MNVAKELCIDNTPAGLQRPVAPSPIDRPLIFSCQNLWQRDVPLLDTLREYYGDRRLDSFGGSYGWSVRYRQVEDYDALGIHTLSQYLDAFESGESKLPYLRHLSVNRAMPELRAHIKQPAEFRPNWVNHPWLDRFSGPEFFIGQAGTSFGHVHQDQVCVHIGFVQLQGEKQFVLFPPEDAPYLYTFHGREFPYQLRNSRVRYADLPDNDRFPLLRRTRARYLTLRAGQALLLPANWWHTTYNLTDSISYSVRIINRSNAWQSLLSHLGGIPRYFAARNPGGSS